MSFLNKAVSFLKNNVLPAAAAAASGNIGAAGGALLAKNKKAPATVGSPVAAADKPQLVLGFENKNGVIAKADFINDEADIKSKKTNEILVWVLGIIVAVAVFFGFLKPSKSR